MRLLGLSRLQALDPPEPVLRYERRSPGEQLHIDSKRLGRIQGIGHRMPESVLGTLSLGDLAELTVGFRTAIAPAGGC